MSGIVSINTGISFLAMSYIEGGKEVQDRNEEEDSKWDDRVGWRDLWGSQLGALMMTEMICKRNTIRLNRLTPSGHWHRTLNIYCHIRSIRPCALSMERLNLPIIAQPRTACSIDTLNARILHFNLVVMARPSRIRRCLLGDDFNEMDRREGWAVLHDYHTIGGASLN